MRDSEQAIFDEWNYDCCFKRKKRMDTEFKQYHLAWYKLVFSLFLFMLKEGEEKEKANEDKILVVPWLQSSRG